MKPITHISQFSLLVCSFALALTGYFILPVEPPLWLGLLLLLLGPAVFYLGRRYHGVTPEAPACPSVCRVWLKGGVRLAYHNRPIGLTQSCRNVDVVVMPFDEARYPCDALLFDKRAFQTRMHRQFSAHKGKLVADEISNARLWQRD